MTRIVVLVNGLPGSGKTTLARHLSAALHLPLLSRDAIKETYADVLGTIVPFGRDGREWSHTLGAAAGETLWTLLADAPGGAVLESPWLAHLRPVVIAGLHRAGAKRPLEIWCDVPIQLARERYEKDAPHRHPMHGEAPVTDEDWQFLGTVAEPLALGPIQRVDTTTEVNVGALATWARSTCGVPNRTTANPGS
ncbi:MAG: AAA family ATPase [Micromonosporaceae bacterium]